MDYATKWVEATATRKDDALISAWFLFEQIFTRFGPPLELVSDRGTHFLNGTVEKLVQRSTGLSTGKQLLITPSVMALRRGLMVSSARS
ncbi:unnamed protein product [Calypogeia fissa]